MGAAFAWAQGLVQVQRNCERAIQGSLLVVIQGANEVSQHPFRQAH